MGILSMSVEMGYSAGAIASAWAGIYSAANKKPLPAVVAKAPLGSDEYLRLLYRGQPFQIAKAIDCRTEIKSGSDRAIVLFSGGKDSLATALKFKRNGITPILLFAHGINPAYPKEIESAKKIATVTGFPLRIVKVKTQKGAYIENPTKNQMLLSIAVDLGVRWGVSNFGAGVMAEENISKTNFEAGYSDAIEMHEAAADWIEGNVAGSSVLRRAIKNDTESILMVEEAGLLKHVQSCMATPRFRGSLHARNKAKFNINLMPERCGSCYKCALEWLHLALVGAEKWNEAFANHCVEIIDKNSKLVTGRKLSRRDALELFIDPKVIDISRIV